MKRFLVFSFMLTSSIAHSLSIHCFNGGTEVNGNCICPCGYMLPFCEYRYNEVSYKFGNEICFDLYNGDEQCVCKDGFVKITNGLNQCVEDQCEKDICLTRGRCLMAENSNILKMQPVCECKNQLSTETNCSANFCNSALHPNCHPEHTESCVTENYDVVCKCKSNLYTGKYCERITNLCETNTCQNGGTCVKMTTTDTCCLCDSSFHGHHCESLIGFNATRASFASTHSLLNITAEVKTNSFMNITTEEMKHFNNQTNNNRTNVTLTINMDTSTKLSLTTMTLTDSAISSKLSFFLIFLPFFLN